jgi:hypothetical protein
MHNLLSFNQLFGWNLSEKVEDKTQTDLVNDYFQCIMECDETEQTCKRVCKELLS